MVVPAKTSSQMSFSAVETASVWHVSPSVHLNVVDPAVQLQPSEGAWAPLTQSQKINFPRDKNNHYTVTQDKKDAPTQNTQNATCVNCKHTEGLQCFKPPPPFFFPGFPGFRVFRRFFFFTGDGFRIQQGNGAFECRSIPIFRSERPRSISQKAEF